MRKIAIVIAITFLLTLLFMVEKEVINFFMKLFKWRLDYLWHASLKYDGILVSFLIGFVLLASLFFIRRQKKMNLINVVLTTGSFTAGIFIIFFLLFSFVSYNWGTLATMTPAYFMIGFLFPILYKLISKKSLINPNFF